nr:hypothetical protein [Segatella albensis]
MYGEIVHEADVSCQRIVLIAYKSGFEGCLTCLRGRKRESAKGVGEASVNRT